MQIPPLLTETLEALFIQTSDDLQRLTPETSASLRDAIHINLRLAINQVLTTYLKDL